MRAADDDNVTEEQRSCQAIGKLFKCVLFKLGKKIAHEKILLHDDGLVIDRALTTCNSHIFRSIFIHLDFWYKQSIFDDSFAKLEIVQGMWNRRNAFLKFLNAFLKLKISEHVVSYHRGIGRRPTEATVEPRCQ